MHRDFNGTSDYLLGGTNLGLGSDTPWTISCWFWADAAAADMCIFSLGNSGNTNEYFQLLMRSNRAMRFRQASSGFSQAATTSALATLNAWNHAAATYVSTTDRNVFLNGGNKNQNTLSVSYPSGLNQTGIGVRATPTLTEFWDGRTAHVAVWRGVALSDAEIAALANKRSPLLVRPNNLVFYAPIYGGSPERDIWQNRSLTVSGTRVLPTSLFLPQKKAAEPSWLDAVDVPAGGGGGGNTPGASRMMIAAA